MRYYRIQRGDRIPLVAEADGAAYDLTETDPGPGSFTELADAAALTDQSVDDIARRHLDDAPEVDLETVHEHLIRAVDPDEVWGGGVTYAISQESREGEGGLEEVYIGAYEGDRPEAKGRPRAPSVPTTTSGFAGTPTGTTPNPNSR